MLNFRLPIAELRRERRVGGSLKNQKSTILNLQLLRRVPPGERDLTSSDGDPGTNGVISKTRCGAWNKDDSRDFASSHLAPHSVNIESH
jgi:hypothetical protein